MSHPAGRLDKFRPVALAPIRESNGLYTAKVLTTRITAHKLFMKISTTIFITCKYLGLVAAVTGYGVLVQCTIPPFPSQALQLAYMLRSFYKSCKRGCLQPQSQNNVLPTPSFRNPPALILLTSDGSGLTVSFDKVV